MAKHGAGASTFSDWWAYKFEVYEAIPYNPKIMADRGVIVAINSDDAEMARRLNQEAAKSVMYAGMKEHDAWKMVTINPAKLLHVDDRTGSIKAGKDADVVLWNDHPLSVYASAEKTWVDGILFFDRQEDLKLQDAVQKERARTWYGYDYESADEYSKRRAREFERWELRDSTKEVKRIADAIETPYFAVFFADSTLALYNKEAATGLISFPESRHYVFSPNSMSLDIYPPGYLPVPGAGWVDKWDVQVLSLTETRMTLFLPHEAEIVELVRMEFKLP